MKNVEIKARLADRSRVQSELALLGARDAGQETQHDVFWQVPHGRLKLRTSSRDGSMLIHYERADAAELRLSHYLLAAIPDPEAVRRLLDAALEPAGEVHKQRRLWFVDNVRVHLDRVAGLGDFLELEGVVDATHSLEACRARAAELLERFGIRPADHVAVAYVDLLPPRSDPGRLPR